LSVDMRLTSVQQTYSVSVGGLYQQRPNPVGAG